MSEERQRVEDEYVDRLAEAKDALIAALFERNALADRVAVLERLLQKYRLRTGTMEP